MIVSASSGKTVNMRAEPNSSASILQAIPIGSTVEVLETNGTWSKIKYLTTDGYMMTKFLTNESNISKEDLKKIYNSLKATLNMIEEVIK